MTPIKNPSESVVIKFDFTGEMTSIASAVVTIAVHGGRTDPGVGSMLQGVPTIIGTEVLQRVQGGLEGLSYRLKCVATSGLDVIVRTDIMPVRTVPA